MRTPVDFEYLGVNPFTIDYSTLFQKVRVWSIDLQKPGTLESYLEQRYKWIRRDDSRHFNFITRRPTVGCYVELFKVWQPDCVPITSAEGKKLIRKLCYF